MLIVVTFKIQLLSFDSIFNGFKKVCHASCTLGSKTQPVRQVDMVFRSAA